VRLDGGWRVYSSGAGIGLSLIVRRFLGVNIEADVISLDPVMPAALGGLRVQMKLFDRPVEVIYEIAAKGCGVNALHVNDQALPLTHDANPHRRGAARVARAAFVGHLRKEGNVVRISLD
jgi:cellobiose phosphorylase